jgi:CRP-like cAMP-binding protein
MMLVGSFSFAVTIAVMSSVIANQDILYMEFRQNMESLSDYMHHHAMPDSLQQKLKNHFSYLYAMQYGKLEIDILAHLPKSLRSEVMKLNVPLLEGVPFCKGLRSLPFLVEEVAKLLKPRTYSPNEAVVLRNAPIRDVFIIRNGKVNVLLPSDDKSTLESLLVGDHFGGFEFFFGTPSEYGYITASFTELLSLQRKDFEELMLSPMFDAEARSIDFTVSLINSELMPKAVGKVQKTDGQKVASDEDVVPKHFIEELTKWAANQSAVDAAFNVERGAPPQAAFFGGSPGSKARTRRTSRPSFHRDSSIRSASSIDEDGEGEKFLGVVLTFLDWLEQRKKMKGKVEQMQKNIGKKNKLLEMMDETDGEEKAKGVILANSLFRVIWDVTLLISTTWSSLAIPYRLYVQSRAEGSPWGDELGFGIFVDYVFDAFCFVNIILNARFFANTEINENGKLTNIVDKELIFGEYWHSGRMTMDVFIAIPFDFLGFAFGAWNFCRVPKMLASFRFPYLVGRLKEHLDRHKVHVSLDAILAINLTIASIVFTHWSSCMWAMMGENLGESYQEDKAGFIASVYYSLTTMTTVGFGDITPVTVSGRWFSIAMMILGSCFTAGVIANITAMAHKIEIAEDNVQHVTTCVEKYMLEKELPFDIVERCNRYFQMLNHMQDSAKVERKLIPPAFLPAIANHNHAEAIMSTPLFSSVKSSSGLMQSIALLLKEQIVVQGDWIIHDNPSHHQWYYLKEGVVHLKNEKGELLESLRTTGTNGPNNTRCFGEYSLFNLKRHFHAYSNDNCVLTSLHPVAFRSLENVYPEEFKTMGKFVDDLVKEESSRLPLQMTELKSARRNSLMVEIISASKSFAGSELDKPNSFRRFFLYFRGDAVCSPDSNFQLYWNLFVFFVLSYNLFMVPFRLAFENSDSFNFVLIVDYFGDFVWLLDSRVSQSERKCEKRSKWQEGLSSGLLVVFSLLAPVVGW